MFTARIYRVQSVAKIPILRLSQVSEFLRQRSIIEIG